MQGSISYFVINEGKLLVGRTSGEVEEATTEDLNFLYKKTTPSNTMPGGRHDADELRSVA
jgi:hypothetical protein